MTSWCVGANGAVVASAPKAEVGISGANLFLGQFQAVRLSLIGATMALRVDPNGQVSVSAGTENSPRPDAPFVVGTSRRGGMALASTDQNPAAPSGAAPNGQDIIAALLGWLDGLNALGLDGRDLSEIGLKNGSVVVDDRRSGKQWNFDNINLSLTRPKEGGVAFTLTSSGADGPWSLTATVTPREDGRRAIEAVVRDLSPKDILLALRANGGVEAGMPLSAILRAEIGPDGSMLTGEGRIVAGAGFFGNVDDPKKPRPDRRSADAMALGCGEPGPRRTAGGAVGRQPDQADGSARCAARCRHRVGLSTSTAA